MRPKRGLGLEEPQLRERMPAFNPSQRHDREIIRAAKERPFRVPLRFYYALWGSMLAHGVLFMAFAVWMLRSESRDRPRPIVVAPARIVEELPEPVMVLPERPETPPLPEEAVAVWAETEAPPRLAAAFLAPRAEAEAARSDVFEVGALPAGWLHRRMPRQPSLATRQGPAKEAALQRYGGTPETEAAVRRALQWLAAHQHKSGGWRFDHRHAPCLGRCGNPGTNGSATAATGLVLLAFLGAGQTDRTGPHQETIERGLYYLQSQALLTPNGYDLQQSSMYGQGIATLALCEAYALTKDESLRKTCEESLRFIAYAQHSEGGWRYYPNQPGDMTVSAWQWMALKSGRAAGLRVSGEAVDRAERFLDRMQADGGAHYGYLTPGKEPTPTAIGLLARMYYGAELGETAQVRGAHSLAKLGPSKSDLYFNYYATQVLFHRQEREWEAWNKKLRAHLISTQSLLGHEAGSWHFVNEHGLAGGRLYHTAMGAMILEVYYRYLPLYGDGALNFPL